MPFFLPGLNPNLWIGDGSDGLLTPPTGTLPAKVPDYTTFTVNAGVTITAPISTLGPLLIRATTLIDIAGTLTAKGKGRYMGTTRSAGAGNGDASHGSMLGPVGLRNYAIPVPGGSGGKGGFGPGAMAVLSAERISQPSFYGYGFRSVGVAGLNNLAGMGLWSIDGSATGVGHDGAWALVNNLGTAGADDTTRPGNFDISTLVKPELGIFATGSGGGCGGGESEEDMMADGGDGGSAIVLIAPTVRLRAGSVLDARGDDGSIGRASNGGGGGGGGGGCIAIICRQLILTDAGGNPLPKNTDASASSGVKAASYNIWLAGGSGGAGNGTGFAGGAGYTGAYCVRKVL